MWKNIAMAVRMSFRVTRLEATLLLVVVLAQRLGGPISLLFLERLVDGLERGSALGDAMRTLALFVGILAVSELFAALLDPVVQRLRLRMQAATDEEVLKKATSLSLQQMESPATHDLIEQSVRDTGNRVGRVYMLTVQTIAAAAAIVSTFAILASTSPVLALLVLLAAVPIQWSGIRQGKRLHHLTKRQSPSRRLTQYLGNLLSRREAATELRAYQLVPYFLHRWKVSFVQRRADHLDVRWKGVVEGWVADVVSTAFFVAAFVLVARLTAAGQVGVGQVVLIITAVKLLQEQMTYLAQTVGFLWEGALPLQELRTFLELPSEELEARGDRPFPARLERGIEFENVTFRYPGAEKAVLENVSFRIAPGESVALVGPNGAGKSTLIKLMLGLYRPTSGRIAYDGLAIESISLDSLRSQVSCVFQDFVRYEMSLRDNVAFGRPGASDAEVAAAGSAADLDAFAASLPSGYDTQMGKSFRDGTELSGGQWQRVALARSFIRGAQVIVLDEPTAALDPVAELNVFAKFAELVKGKTSVLISHRLGSARMADRILVVQDGRIAESGTHEELLGAGGLYAEFFEMQAKWYKDVAEGGEAG
ncbi:MAG TPA: ABC transporter ATP-binding protein [Paenibacillus sp.]|nr:ABC transporter ATP-binding protein [Paenibacillus sp.]